jgi:hypothetical protein
LLRRELRKCLPHSDFAKYAFWDLHSFGILRCVKSEVGADLTHIAAEEWNQASARFLNKSFLT